MYVVPDSIYRESTAYSDAMRNNTSTKVTINDPQLKDNHLNEVRIVALI
jgi:hypothetical protein